jgi:hypothetical protein
MAKAYLGKISALVTANTSDFNSKLNASANELRSFAKSVQGNITRATQDANRAFTSILTPLQKFEASLKAASSMRLSFKGFAGAIKNVEELKQRLTTLKDSQVDLVVSASGMKSITDFRNAIGDISNKDVRILADVGGLEKLRELRNIIETEGGKTIATQVRVKAEDLDSIIAKFERIDKKQIDAVIRVLGEADLDAALIKQQQLYSAAKQIAEPLSAAVSQFGKLSAEVQTAFIPAMNRAQDATQNLQSDIESGVRVGQERFKSLEAQVLRTAEAIGRLAEASSIASSIRTGRELEFRQPRAQAALTSARAASSEAAGSVALNPRAFEASQVAIKRESDALVQLIALRESATEQGERGTASIIQSQIDTRTSALERQTAEYRKLIAAEKELQRIVVGARTDISSQIEAARLAEEEAAFRARAADQTERQAAAANRLLAADISRREAMKEQRDAFGSGVDLAPQPPPEQLFGRRQRTRDSELSRTQELNRQFQALPDDVQSSLAGEAKALNNIATSAKAGAAGVETLASANDRMAASIGQANATLDAQAAKTKVLDDFRKRFADFDEALSVRSVAAFARELTVMEDVAAGVSAQFRGPMVAAMNAFRNAADRAIDSRNFDSEEVRAELALLRAEFIRTAKDAGLSGTQISNSLSRAGDVGRGGADKFSLALNQAAFAIDDFFSATGGLEFKIRAVSNNVTQLAFILGGTAGLFAGLAAVIGGQLLIAYDKFFNKSDEAKRRLEAMNEALSRQKTLAEELSQAYRALADSIERSAMSRAASQTREREQEVGGIRERQRERRGRLVAELDGRVGQREAIIAELEEKLGTEIDRFKRQAIQAQIRKLRADIEGITQAAERGADRQIDRATRQSQFTGRTRVAELRRGREDADRDLREAQLALGDNAPDDAVFRGRTLGQYREALIEFDVALQKLADNAATAALELNSQQARQAAAAQSRLEGSFGDQPSRISSTLDFAASLRRQFFEELQKGNASEEAFADFSAEISKVERVLIQAADAAASFADVLDRQVASLARAVEGDLVSAEGNARRTANRLESQLGPNDPRVVEARDNEQRLTRERQRAERERQRIDQEIEGQRARYEDELLDGRGSPADVERARRIRELDSQANSLVLTEENRRAARQEADRLRLEQQQAFESRPDIQRLRRRADEGDIEAQRELQRQESAERGRRYSMTPAQRAGEELDQQVADIREYFSQAAENSTGLPEDVAKIRNRMNEAIARAEEDFMRQIAPVTMGLRDSVQNAVMQGPSRAALNASDATTMEGARELNRLLRGDDSAKDVDLVALQKEANAILERIAQKQNPVAN